MTTIKEFASIYTGDAVRFTYDGVDFMITLINNYCECYAENQFQFGFEIDQDGHTENMNELIEMLINNYNNGNIFIEE